MSILRVVTCKRCRAFDSFFMLTGGSKRLTDLDLRGNNLVEVSSLHQLEALKHLHLGE